MYDIEFRGKTVFGQDTEPGPNSLMWDSGLYTVWNKETETLRFTRVGNNKVLFDMTEEQFFSAIEVKCQRIMFFVLDSPNDEEMYKWLIYFDLPWLHTCLEMEVQYIAGQTTGLMKTYAEPKYLALWEDARWLICCFRDLMLAPYDDITIEAIKISRRYWSEI